MGALMDLFKVLYEPGAVFARVAEKPKFLMPFVGVAVVQMLLTAANLPYMQAAMQAARAANPQAAAGPDPSKFAAIGIIFVPIGLVIAFLIGAGLLWVLTSVMAGEAKFMTLLSVVAYSAMTTVVLLGIVGTIVIHLRGVDTVTSMQDLQPALGLDLLAPDAGHFLTAVLKAVNPFGIWGVILTAIGIQVTHKTSKGSAYGIAITGFVIGILIAGGLAAAFGGRAG